MSYPARAEGLGKYDGLKKEKDEWANILYHTVLNYFFTKNKATRNFSQPGLMHLTFVVSCTCWVYGRGFWTVGALLGILLGLGSWKLDLLPTSSFNQPLLRLNGSDQIRYFRTIFFPPTETWPDDLTTGETMGASILPFTVMVIPNVVGRFQRGLLSRANCRNMSKLPCANRLVFSLWL